MLLHQPAEVAASRQKAPVCALLDDAPALKRDDPICVQEEAQGVAGEDHSLPLQPTQNHMVHDVLPCVGVDCGERVV